MARAILAFLVTLAILLAEASSPLPPPSPLPHPLSPTPSCIDMIVSFSPCLPYASSPPNNRSDTPTENCCKAFFSAFNSGVSVCFCYLLREPMILGFPLNNTRILSLSSVCPPTDGTSARIPTLDFLCAASPAMPPLHSAAQGIASPSNSGSRNAATPPPIISPKSGQRSLAIPTKAAETSMVPSQDSSENKQIYSSKSWLLVGMLAILAPLLTTL
ncbi:hypothetical protein L6164_025697 [Bauhinia variegata]|uniref:Uncharacterized protein n=1 Tax=Bauhinia variegata TaxID=167791 RepID=A0ACB9M481_BAUVA|nr:hypothetical protein L6164_025697 [Bauhinia variegata]